ncbi:hypothetical protein ACYZTL_02965 [Pseudomonas sp. LB3P81]
MASAEGAGIGLRINVPTTNAPQQRQQTRDPKQETADKGLASL